MHWQSILYVQTGNNHVVYCDPGPSVPVCHLGWRPLPEGPPSEPDDPDAILDALDAVGRQFNIPPDPALEMRRMGEELWQGVPKPEANGSIRK